MKYDILIVGHAQYPMGIASVLSFVTGIDDNIYTYCLEENTNITKYKEKIFKHFSLSKNLIIFTDIIGGSPHQIIAEKLLTEQWPNIILIASAPMSLIMELVMKVSFLTIQSQQELLDYLTKVQDNLNKYTHFLIPKNK